MKRLVSGVIAFSLFFLPFLFWAPTQVKALDPLDVVCEDIPSGDDAPAACNTNGNNDPISGENGVILQAVNILAWIVGAAAVIMLIFAGLKFITANGDANSIATARNSVIYTLIGVVVFSISNLIVRFVISIL